MQALTKNREWRKIFGALQNRNFRIYWIGEFAYYGGLRMRNLAQSWLVYEMTKSAFLLGVVAASQGLPRIILSLLGGILADKVKKKHLLFAIQVGLGLNVFVLAILVSRGVVEYWHIALSALLDGTLISFALPARLAFVSEIVSKDDFLNAYALYYVALNLMSTVGPSLAGFLVAGTGVAGIFYIVGACQWALSLILVPIRVSGTVASRPKTSVKKDIIDILSFARRTPIILILMGLQISQTFLAMPARTLLPVFAVDLLGVGAFGLGMLGAATGIGALVGSLLVTAIGDFKRKTLLLLGSGVARGASLILFASSRTFYLSLLFEASGGFASAVYMTLNSSLYQLSATEDMRGRTMSLYMIGSGLQPIGILPMSLAAEVLGAPFAVGVGGALFVMFCVAVSILWPSFRRLSI